MLITMGPKVVAVLGIMLESILSKAVRRAIMLREVG